MGKEEAEEADMVGWDGVENMLEAEAEMEIAHH